MKMNHIFTGIEGETKDDDTNKKLRAFLYYELGIDENIQFGNVHRPGRYVRGQDRPIVARFLYQKDVVAVGRRISVTVSENNIPPLLRDAGGSYTPRCGIIGAVATT